MREIQAGAQTSVTAVVPCFGLDEREAALARDAVVAAHLAAVAIPQRDAGFGGSLIPAAFAAVAAPPQTTNTAAKSGVIDDDPMDSTPRTRTNNSGPSVAPDASFAAPPSPPSPPKSDSVRGLELLASSPLSNSRPLRLDPISAQTSDVSSRSSNPHACPPQNADLGLPKLRGMFNRKKAGG
ncbi:hypothetical protein R3P38DRAFT_3222720 [Favolaschia claudopus]|uniref:Uncharacterized protein n=1 Tax=Favolaschia claudopus TaxID=2862362 RepID=A0AAV9ZXZ6_9AGAR